GLADPVRPLKSALILSRDRLPDPLRQVEQGLPPFDGKLTAEEVLRSWRLDADLVTLSACQSGLGRPGQGGGFVGLAPAFLLAGWRSVVVSLWKVDDAATALLMHRFYSNLLGRREGLRGPMGKAAALHEAQRWLAGLSRAGALRLGADLFKGVER